MSPSTFLNFSDPPLQRAYQYRSFKRWMLKKSEQNVQFPDSHWQGDRTQNSSFMNSFIVPLLIKSHNGTEKETPSLILGICEFHQSYF